MQQTNQAPPTRGSPSQRGEPFRTCGTCGHEWQSREELVADPGLRLLGLQSVPDMPDANLVVFEHACGTSLSVLATRLRDMPGAVDAPSRALRLRYGEPDCEGHCRMLEDLERCMQPCSNTRDRQLVVWIASQAGRSNGR